MRSRQTCRIDLAVAALLALGVVFTCAPSARAQITWYVDDDAPNDPCHGDPNCSDPNEDGSLAHPFDAIQEGIDAAADGDTILVADGTYTGAGNRDIDFESKAITVRSQSDKSDACIIDCQGSEADPHRGFYFHSGEGAASVLGGLTIRNGHTTGGVPEDCGAGVRLEGTSPTLRNCAFSSNSAYRGGAIYCDYSSVTVADCTFSGNLADHGGGMQCSYSSPNLTNCTFSDNSAVCPCFGFGGGMHCAHSFPALTNCIFSGNSADVGGGMLCWDESPSILTNCTFSDNSAHHGAGMFCADSFPNVLTNCIFSGNSATGLGGGVTWADCAAVVTNCTFCGNSAEWDGGGMYCHDGAAPELINCTITGNLASGDGGGIYITESSVGIVSCTISGNRAGHYGGGIYGVCGPTNTIVWGNWADAGGNDGDEWYGDGGCFFVCWNDLNEDGLDGFDTCMILCDYEARNIETDPLFRDPEDCANAPTTAGDYHLSDGSPCIDAGYNDGVPEDLTTDLDGNPRFVDDPAMPDTGNPPGADAIVDMGAYEFQVMLVSLDIKPGSCPNPLNVKSHGVVPMAVVGTPDFDVTLIDLDSLVLTRADGVGGAVAPLIGPPGPKIRVEDVATPFEGEPCDCHELEGDGIDDLSMKFDTELMVSELELNNLPGGAEVEVVVSGALSDGTRFSATDCVRLVPVGPDPEPPVRDVGLPSGDSSQQDMDAQRRVRPPASEQNDANAVEDEDSRDAWVVTIVGCGPVSPAFLLVTVVATRLLRRW